MDTAGTETEAEMTVSQGMLGEFITFIEEQKVHALHGFICTVGYENARPSGCVLYECIHRRRGRGSSTRPPALAMHDCRVAQVVEMDELAIHFEMRTQACTRTWAEGGDEV